MSITAYTELQSAITRWIARDDMASNIPDWITAFEAVANRRLRVLRRTTKFVQLQRGYGGCRLPSDCFSWLSSHLTVISSVFRWNI